MEILDTLYQDGVIDCFAFELSERNPLTGSYTTLATDYAARMLSQVTDGHYDLNGGYGHVGRPVGSSGKQRAELVMGRLSA